MAWHSGNSAEPAPAAATAARPQAITVSVSHDEVRVVREAIAEGTALADLPVSDGVPEIVLTEERIVITKVLVPVERVRLETETVTEQREVTEAVRKEQIEF